MDITKKKKYKKVKKVDTMICENVMAHKSLEEKENLSELNKIKKKKLKDLLQTESTLYEDNTPTLNQEESSFNITKGKMKKSRKHRKSVTFSSDVVVCYDENIPASKKCKSDDNIDTSESIGQTSSTKKDKKKKAKKIDASISFDSYDEAVEVVSKSERHKDKKKKRKNKGEILAENSGDSLIEMDNDKSGKKTKTNGFEVNMEKLTITDKHKFSDLIDEMKVVEKKFKKKSLPNSDKFKKLKIIEKVKKNDSVESLPFEKAKETWTKRRWNKDKRGLANDHEKTVVIENLPLKLLINYKKTLHEHFCKFGSIQKIGVVELYPAENAKPVFSTTITYAINESVVEVLNEDNTLYHGSRIRLKRLYCPTETTIVARSYGECSEQTMSSLFSQCGKIRSIKSIAKGGDSMSTAFVEFDSPESVVKALKVSSESKVGGKKLYVSRYELRTKKAKTRHQEKWLDKGDSNMCN